MTAKKPQNGGNSIYHSHRLSASEFVYLLIYIATLADLLAEIIHAIYVSGFAESSYVMIAEAVVAIYMLLQAYRSLHPTMHKEVPDDTRLVFSKRFAVALGRLIKLVLAAIIISGTEKTPLQTHACFQVLWRHVDLFVFRCATEIAIRFGITPSVFEPLSKSHIKLLGPLSIELAAIFLGLILLQVTDSVVQSPIKNRTTQPEGSGLGVGEQSKTNPAWLFICRREVREYGLGFFFSVSLAVYLSFPSSLLATLSSCVFGGSYMFVAGMRPLVDAFLFYLRSIWDYFK